MKESLINLLLLLQEDGWRHAAAEQEAAERERLVADQRYQHALREVMQHKSATHGEQEQRRQQLARARELAAQQMSDFVAREQQRQALQAQAGPTDVPMVSVARCKQRKEGEKQNKTKKSE